MVMPERDYNIGGYRYGFNGMENDNEVKGNGNSLNFGARIYDSRLGRWLSVDDKEELYLDKSSYCFAINNPIFYTDDDGNVIKAFYQKSIDLYNAAIKQIFAGNQVVQNILLMQNGANSIPMITSEDFCAALSTLDNDNQKAILFGLYKIANSEISYGLEYIMEGDNATDSRGNSITAENLIWMADGIGYDDKICEVVIYVSSRIEGQMKMDETANNRTPRNVNSATIGAYLSAFFLCDDYILGNESGKSFTNSAYNYLLTKVQNENLARISGGNTPLYGSDFSNPTGTGDLTESDCENSTTKAPVQLTWMQRDFSYRYSQQTPVGGNCPQNNAVGVKDSNDENGNESK
jgi:RHS repeat-associated protein